MAAEYSDGGSFELFGRKFDVHHIGDATQAATQVFEAGDAEALLYFGGKRLSVEEATLAVYGWLRGHEVGVLVGAAQVQHQVVQALNLPSAYQIEQLGKRLDALEQGDA